MAKAKRGVAARGKTSKRGKKASVKPARKKVAKGTTPKKAKSRTRHAGATARKTHQKPVAKAHTNTLMEVLPESGGIADTTELALAQSKLEEMSLPKRIAAVAADVDSKRDEYRSIDRHELASLLGIGDADKPGGDWNFVWYIPRVPIEDIFEDIFDRGDKEYILKLLQTHVTGERYKELDKRYDELDSKRLCDFLTDSEKQTIECSYMERQAQAYGSQCTAFYTIKAPHRKKLTFEAYIEDDGGCCDLMTPYDERDGAFSDFSDCFIVDGEPP
jgi:hypothetical protein